MWVHQTGEHSFIDDETAANYLVDVIRWCPVYPDFRRLFSKVRLPLWNCWSVESRLNQPTWGRGHYQHTTIITPGCFNWLANYLLSFMHWYDSGIYNLSTSFLPAWVQLFAVYLVDIHTNADIWVNDGPLSDGDWAIFTIYHVHWHLSSTVRLAWSEFQSFALKVSCDVAWGTSVLQPWYHYFYFSTSAATFITA
jgi:hypothetical protein